MAIPTAIAAFYLPVTLMCLLYFRIYRETVKRRKELHLLQAQNHSSNSQPNTTLIKTMSTAGTTIINDQDESVSNDSTRSRGKILSKTNSAPNQFIITKKIQEDKINYSFNFCCHRR